MILTLAQIISHGTRLAVAPRIPLSLASEYANIAIGLVSQAAGVQHQPKETIAFASTSTSDNRVAFPGDYDYAIGLKVGIPTSWSTATSRTTSWEPLAKRPATWNDPYQSQESSQPRVYGEYATWFELYPSPNSAYSVELRYMRKLSDLTASTATPALDEQWHWACALKTAELIAAYDSNESLEAANARRFGSYVRSIRVDQHKKLMDERGAHMTFGGFGRRR